MAVVELRELASLLGNTTAGNNTRGTELAKDALKRADEVEKAIWEWAVVDRGAWGKVFAYEVDGAFAFCCF